MSATINADLFSSYFGNAPCIQIEGFTFPVTEYFLEDVVEMTDYALPQRSMYALRFQKGQHPRNLRTQYPRHSESTVDVLERMNAEVVNNDLIELLISHITTNTVDGAILVFLPGMLEIKKLYDHLTRSELLKDSPFNFQIHALHSTVDSDKQKAIFQRPSKNTVKVIVSFSRLFH